MSVKRVALACLFLSGITCAPQADPPRTPPPAPASTEIAPPPVPVVGGFKERIDAALEHVRQRDLLTTHGFWTVFHGILGQGLSTTLTNPETNERVNAIDYIRSEE